MYHTLLVVCSLFGHHIYGSSCIYRPFSESGIIHSPEPWTYTLDSELPRDFDWRNVNGVNYVTADLNQHIPSYCGSCWLHASISVLNDRLKIYRNASFPEISLARQVVLNCGNVTAGSCSGGTDLGLYKFAHLYGLPDTTCQLYSADDSFSCTAHRNCMNCDPKSEGGKCFAVHSYDRFFVSEFSAMVNASTHQMRSEIFRRGPIACAVDSSFMEHGKYDLSRPLNVQRTSFDWDHLVEIVGWESASDDEKIGNFNWIVRNSWGRYWGMDGWFKVRAGVNSIGIESNCSWAVIQPQSIRSNYGSLDFFHSFPSVM